MILIVILVSLFFENGNLVAHTITFFATLGLVNDHWIDPYPLHYFTRYSCQFIVIIVTLHFKKGKIKEDLYLCGFIPS